MRRSHAGVLLSITAHVAVVTAVAARTVIAQQPAAAAVDEPRIEPVTRAMMAPVIEVEYLASDAPATVAAIAPVAITGNHTVRASPRRIAPTITPDAAVTGRPRAEDATEVHVAPALPSVRDAADHLVAARPSPAAAVAVADDGSMPASSAITMRVAPDGTARIFDRRNLRVLDRHAWKTEREVSAAEGWMDTHHEHSNAVDMKMPPVGPTIATFDMTDWAMRAAGQDPYAAQKLRLLDATRDQRAQIGARHREQQLLQTPALVRASLEDIARLPAAQRKEALGELWRDCDHSSAGELARATILSYARDHFTEAERAELR